MLFWLLEGAVFTVFLYLTLNASEEPFYMYDQIKYNKTHLYSWRIFIVIAALNVLLITLTHALQLSLKWLSFTAIKGYLLIISFIVLFLLTSEFYQFYHIVGFYNNLF
jgi:hypothetical protein